VGAVINCADNTGKKIRIFALRPVRKTFIPAVNSLRVAQ
jgi:hypothetical protein